MKMDNCALKNDIIEITKKLENYAPLTMLKE